MKPDRLMRRIASGSLANVDFSDFRRLVEAYGFRLIRVTGSHHAFGHPRVPEMLNLQPVGGEAKPYQVRQFLRLVERYDLRMESGR
jgi:hypothetical protein